MCAVVFVNMALWSFFLKIEQVGEEKSGKSRGDEEKHKQGKTCKPTPSPHLHFSDSYLLIKGKRRVKKKRTGQKKSTD